MKTVNPNGSIFNKGVQLLVDVDIIGRSGRDVTNAFSVIERESADLVLTVNKWKDKIVEIISSFSFSNWRKCARSTLAWKSVQKLT